MFAIRVHSTDIDHPLFHSLPSHSNPNPNPNAKFADRRGLIHLFGTLDRNPSTHHQTNQSPTRSTLLFIVAVPNYFSSDDLLRLFASHMSDISEFLIIRNDGVEDRYSVLIRTENQVFADGFYYKFNGKRFSPPEVEICHILFVHSAEFTEFADIASTPPPGHTELPTCPICLERLDQDTSGIQITLCDHSFQCSCMSKWTYSSCQVCRLCQQQDEKSNCSVCGTSESLWVCILCGFVGCGRYKEGHALGHWKDTQHCYSLDLDTQWVWDYEGHNFVHRLNQSKADGNSVMDNSDGMSHDGDFATCGDGEDPEITGALFNSKVDRIMVEYNHLLATQLENQRQEIQRVLYYESLLADAKNKRENTIVKAVEDAVTTKMQDLLCQLEKYEEDKKVVSNMNQVLMWRHEEYKRTMKELDRKMASVKLKVEQIIDLEEQERPAASKLRNKAYPLYYKFVEVYGVDRATGDNAQTVAEMRWAKKSTPSSMIEKVDKLVSEKEISLETFIELDGENVQKDGNEETTDNSETQSSSKRAKGKKAKVIEDDIQGVKEGLQMMNPSRIDESSIWSLLEEMGVDDHISARAFCFLVRDPSKFKAILASPARKRNEVLKIFMETP